MCCSPIVWLTLLNCFIPIFWFAQSGWYFYSLSLTHLQQMFLILFHGSLQHNAFFLFHDSLLVTEIIKVPDSLLTYGISHKSMVSLQEPEISGFLVHSNSLKFIVYYGSFTSHGAFSSVGSLKVIVLKSVFMVHSPPMVHFVSVTKCDYVPFRISSTERK